MLMIARLHERIGVIFMSKFKGKKILLIIVVIIVIIIATFGMRKLLFKIDLENRYKEFEKVQTLETKGTLSYVEDKSFAVVNEKDYVFVSKGPCNRVCDKLSQNDMV